MLKIENYENSIFKNLDFAWPDTYLQKKNTKSILAYGV